MKKIGCLILCLLFSVITLCACSSTYENSFLKHNYPRDYRQVIVTINPVNESGTRADGSAWSYTSDKVDIRKSQLVNYINNYGATYMNYYGMTYNQVVDYFVEQLILTELVIISADAKFEEHAIFWTQDDIEEIQRSVYDQLDSQLTEICNEILSKGGRDTLIVPDEAAESAETTYPVKESEDPEEDRNSIEEEDRIYGSGNKHDDWYLNGDWFIYDNGNWHSLPGNYGDAEQKSLTNEGVKRLVAALAESAENLINVTEDETKTIKDEVKKLNETIANKGVAYAYRDLGKTLLVKKLFGDSYIMTYKMNLLQDYIENSVTVTEDEIVEKYNKMLEDQMLSYADDNNFDSAATGTGVVLYRPNDNYVYVKHILIPFSDEQTAYLKDFQEVSTEEEYLAERARLVNNIKAYEHVNGEDDTSRELRVDQIWSEVKSAMNRVSASAYQAERLFDDFIYKYNTDPGIFNNEYGYAVKYKLADDESEKYMTEFAEVARAFRNEGYKVGEIYDKYIITDYGVHIMYYAADYKAGYRLGLNDYTTPGRYNLVKDLIKEDLLSSKVSGAYTDWQNTTVYYYRNIKKVEGTGEDIVKLIESAYKDLYTE